MFDKAFDICYILLDYPTTVEELIELHNLNIIIDWVIEIEER